MIEGPKDGTTEGQRDGRTEGQRYGRMDGLKDVWKDGRMTMEVCDRVCGKGVSCFQNIVHTTTAVMFLSAWKISGISFRTIAMNKTQMHRLHPFYNQESKNSKIKRAFSC